MFSIALLTGRPSQHEQPLPRTRRFYYGSREALVLLGAIDNRTGADCDIPSNWRDWQPTVRKVEGLDDFADVMTRVTSHTQSGDAAEGFVLKFTPADPDQPSARVKVKFAEYVRLHRMLTGTTSLDVWEAMSSESGLGPDGVLSG